MCSLYALARGHRRESAGALIIEHASYLDRIPSYGYDRLRLTLILDMLWTNIGAKLEHAALVRQRGPAAA